MPRPAGDGKGPATIMVLGPRTFLDRITDERRSIVQSRPDLLPLREDLARVLRSMRKGNVVVMESEEDVPGEKHIQKFLRIVKDRNVGVFFILWPCRAQMKGVDVEMGHVLTALAEGRLSPDNVHVFVEDGVVRMDEEGVIRGHSEDGNRTWYYEDLLGFGCPYYTWRTLQSLYVNVAVAAGELWDDAPAGRAEAQPEGQTQPQ